MIKIGIVGGTGYTGVELLRLLCSHPEAEVIAVTSRKEDGLRVSDMYPSLRGHTDLTFSAPDKVDLTRCDVVFFATPHGVAMNQARELLEAGVRIIDLAADFRMKDLGQFEKWYGMAHTCPEIVEHAVYGLTELNREAIASARVVGNPGCYPTTMQLGYAPLLRAKAIEPASLIADCKSGVSGAGRKAELGLLFSENSDNFKAYSVGGHRHHPETVAQLEKQAGEPVRMLFVPHLVPMIRGMQATLYAALTPDAKKLGNDGLQALFEKAYQDEPFVDVMPFGSTPDTRSVRASNTVRIALHRPQDGDTLIVLVVQDNLTKGAAGQAIQNMNVMFGLKETMGLAQVPVLP